jgi:hypothetical protein
MSLPRFDPEPLFGRSLAAWSRFAAHAARGCEKFQRYIKHECAKKYLAEAATDARF